MEAMVSKQVCAGRLMAELAEHSHDLAAVERGVIGDVQNEFPAWNPMAHGLKLRIEIGFLHSRKVLPEALPYR